MLEHSEQIQKFLDQCAAPPEQMVQWYEFFNGTLGKRIPIGLIHSCCGPCSLYPFKSLTSAMALTCYYFNPNIHPLTEYRQRLQTQIKAMQWLNANPENHVIGLKIGRYCPADFFKVAQDFAREPEGGQRCRQCFRLRLEETAKKAQIMGCHYFLSVMSVSSHKSSAQLSDVLHEIFETRPSIRPLIINFKKNDGTHKGRTLSRTLNLYHQPYCGCIYSMPKNS